MEYMKTVPDNAFILALIDPPYGIHKYITNKGKKKASKGNKFTLRYDLKQWDKKRPPAKFWKEVFRVSENQMIFGANYFTQYLPVSRGWVFWDKQGDGLDQVNNELIFTSFEKSIKTFSRCHGMDKGFMADHEVFHPTVKPVELYRWLLMNYQKKQGRVFDPFLGSGSSAIAAHDLGFEFVGCEIDPDYFAGATDRYNKHKQQLRLF